MKCFFVFTGPRSARDHDLDDVTTCAEMEGASASRRRDGCGASRKKKKHVERRLCASKRRGAAPSSLASRRASGWANYQDARRVAGRLDARLRANRRRGMRHFNPAAAPLYFSLRPLLSLPFTQKQAKVITTSIKRKASVAGAIHTDGASGAFGMDFPSNRENAQRKHDKEYTKEIQCLYFFFPAFCVFNSRCGNPVLIMPYRGLTRCCCAVSPGEGERKSRSANPSTFLSPAIPVNKY